MYVRVTMARLQPETEAVALHIINDIMLPRASEQPGFVEAQVLSEPSSAKIVILSYWATQADLESSQPPQDIRPDVERLGTMLSDVVQGVYEVIRQH